MVRNMDEIKQKKIRIKTINKVDRGKIKMLEGKLAQLENDIELLKYMNTEMIENMMSSMLQEYLAENVEKISRDMKKNINIKIKEKYKI